LQKGFLVYKNTEAPASKDFYKLKNTAAVLQKTAARDFFVTTPLNRIMK